MAGLVVEAVAFAAGKTGIARVANAIVKKGASKSGIQAAEAAMARAKGYFVKSAQESASVFEAAFKGGEGSFHLARPSYMDLFTEKVLGFLDALPFIRAKVKPSQLELMSKVTGKKPLADAAQVVRSVYGNVPISIAKKAGEKPGTYVLELASVGKRGTGALSKAAVHVDQTGALPVISLESASTLNASQASARIDFGALKSATAESIATDMAASVATKGNQLTASLHAGNAVDINVTGDVQKTAELMDKVAETLTRLDGVSKKNFAGGTPQTIVSHLETLRLQLAHRLADIKKGLFGIRPSVEQEMAAARDAIAAAKKI